MKSDVAIIGGGFSGTILAAQLARRGLSVTLVEGGGRAGLGTAYSTPEDAHLLNVAAARMSAWPDRPDDFVEAVAGDGYTAGDYVPRKRFGAYLKSILADAKASGRVELVDQKAVSIEPGWRIALADGSAIEARAIALAQGNQPPEPLGFARAVSPALFVNDPWSVEGREAARIVAQGGGDVLIIGTGLTMVDVVLTFDEAGHRGKILALSRRGLAPRAHDVHEPSPVDWDEVPAGSVTALGRWLRHRRSNGEWRAAVDSLRPHSHKLWRSFDAGEQRRFLRHARPWWDVHRHRIAPQVSARLERLSGEGRLEIAAGRIAWMRGSDRLETGIRFRGHDEIVERSFALGLNCTGPLGAIARTKDGVLRSLFDAGLARPNDLGIGVEVDERSRIAGAPYAWALGPLSKGAFWEIVAVPDIRGQAQQVADDMAEELKA